MQVIIHTDGSCLSNPDGPGGWAAVMRYGRHAKVIWGCSPATTSPRMETVAVIEALRRLRRPCNVRIVSDAQITVNQVNSRKRRSINQKCPESRRRGKAILYALYDDLRSEQSRHLSVSAEWVRGHAGIADNHMADKYAGIAARKQECGELLLPVAIRSAA